MTNKRHILLVEDDDNDAELTMREFMATKFSNLVVRVRDGREAIDYLFGRGAYAGRDTGDVPAVVLLDLNMPRLHGLHLLEVIRADVKLKSLPVVVLTSSDEERDRLAAYRHHANSYVRKPVDHAQFSAAARELGLYWLLLNQPPPRE